jgi:hypothetical protein
VQQRQVLFGRKEGKCLNKVLTFTLLILVVFGLLVCGMCEVAANADDQAERDYAALMKHKRTL